MGQNQSNEPDNIGSQQDPTSDDAILTYNEICATYKLKKGTVFCWVSQRSIPHIRLGPRTVRFRQSDIERWLRQRTVGGAPHSVRSAGSASVVEPRAQSGATSPTQELPGHGPHNAATVHGEAE